MSINHQVKQGDCISSIAFENGFFPDTIWNHPNNATLREKRPDPNVLVPNDVVFVPDKRLKVVSEPTNQVHKFQLKNTPAVFSVQLFDYLEEPRANQNYEFIIDDKLTLTGTTTSQGVLEVTFPPNSNRGVLTVGDDREVVEFFFGYLETTSEVRGMQARLQNLGFECPISGKLDGETIEAMKAFQRRFNLEITGKADSATLDKLEELHDAINKFPKEDSNEGQLGNNPFDDGEVDDEQIENQQSKIQQVETAPFDPVRGE
jgi:hypothetical protein